jgi:uncharacterized protein (TIGR04551 family)
MSRLFAALAASLLVAAQARAQDDKKPAAGEVDAKTRAAIQREVEKAKDDLRDEVRAEIQGAQSAAEFLGAVAEGPKLEFLQLDGYLRLRGQMMVNLDVTGARDASGHTLFPAPLSGGDTLSTANMRLRLDPTLNVSEHVRVRAQVDVLDNRVLGSSTSALFDDPSSPYPVPFYGTSRVPGEGDPREDRPAISPKRAWAEVQTPVGLLSFGRMPSEWGIGILTHAGAGIDDDFGDSMDRIQFALPPVSTPLGRLAFVPIIDFDAEGVLNGDPRANPGVGQPFDADSADDARTYGVKIARLDTEDEVRRKLERNERSLNYGLYYNYRAQRRSYPAWNIDGFDGTYPGDPGDTTPTYGGADTTIQRKAYAHIADLWLRWLGPRLRVEAELVGVSGQIGNASNVLGEESGEIQLRQWGGSVVADYKIAPNKFTLGAEVGAASGDDAPGFGNVPSRVVAADLPNPGGATPYGSVEGQQWRPGTDQTIRNFRFNPAYRVDLVLWRHVLGQVTDAMYVKPKFRWDILPGLALDVAVIYSRAMFAESTPSSVDDGAFNLLDEGSADLGIEADAIVTYTSGDGFQLFGEWGVLQPLSGLEAAGASGSRAHFLAVGLAARF